MNAPRFITASMLTTLLGTSALGQGPTPSTDQSRPARSTSTPVPISPAPLDRANLEAWLDGFMPTSLASSDTAGAVVVVVKNGQVLLQKGYGYSDVARRTPVIPDKTLFRIGSVSKLFTWTAVMQLAERGKLDLDRDVNAYLDFKIPPYAGQPVTMRNLLTHTAGFEESIRYLIGSGNSATPLNQWAKQALPKRVFAPGTTPAYSNYGAALAGYIVERVSGQSYDDYMDQHVLRPLDMTRSTSRQPLPAALQPLLSKGYQRASGEPQPFEVVEPAPAGSVSASGADMARFMLAHLAQGRGLLRPDTAKMMHGTALTLLPPLNGMALGFYEQNVNGHRVIAHGGDTPTFHSDLYLFPADRVGLFVSLNSAGNLDSQRTLRKALFTQFADRYFPAPRSEARVSKAVALQHARMMAGSYSNSRGSYTNFFNVLDLFGQSKMGVNPDGSLSAPSLTGLGQQPRQWVETGPFVWREADGGERLAAKVVNGQVARWSFDEVSPIMVFGRVPWYKDSAWLLPAFLASLAVVLLTAVAWPAGLISRRVAGAPFVGTPSLRTYRFTQGFAWLAVLTLGLWAAFLVTTLSNLTLLGGALDPLLWTAQILTPIAFAGLLGFAAVNLWRTWAGPQGWFSRVWSVSLLLAAVVLLWVAAAFHLIGFGMYY